MSGPEVRLLDVCPEVVANIAMRLELLSLSTNLIF
jgi:hypothetical protein